MDEVEKEIGRQNALARFREIEQRLPLHLEELLLCDSHRRGSRPYVPHCAGVYLFSEDEEPRYVGRTRDCNRRHGDHTQPKAPQNRASFAFNLALREAGEAKLNIVAPRAEVAVHPEFIDYFSAAKARVRAMEFRFVPIGDPVVSTLFEIYAAIALQTEGDFNLFETH